MADLQFPYGTLLFEISSNIKKTSTSSLCYVALTYYMEPGVPCILLSVPLRLQTESIESLQDQRGLPEELFAVKMYALTPDAPKRVHGTRAKAQQNRPGIIK